MTYVVGFTGSRHYKPTWKVTDMLAHYNRIYDDLFVRVGDCPTGVDAAVARYCEDNNIPGKIYVADWKKYGNKKAGPIRNREMVDSGLDILIAYPEDDSRGTKDCAEYAYSKGVEVWFPDLPAWAQWAVPVASGAIRESILS